MARNDFQSNYLAHHGILGMKWGVRRYQNDDGSLTAAGRERYGVKEGGGISDISSAKGIKRRLNDVDKAIARNKYHRGKALAKVNSKAMKSSNTKNATKAEKHSDMIRKGEQETDRLLNKAEKMGYDVKSSYTVRNVSSGAEIIGRTLLGSALATSMLLPFGRFAIVHGKPSLVGGKKYNVKEKDTEVKKSAQKEAKEYEKRIKQEAKEVGKKAEAEVAKKQKTPLTSSQSINNAVERGLANNKAAKEYTIKKRVDYAKNTGYFDMEFLERNLDLDPVTEKQMTGQKLYDAYEKFLEEEYKKK